MRILRGLALLAAAAVAGAQARTFHVDAERGNDTQDGLKPETAWRSLAKVNVGPVVRPRLFRPHIVDQEAEPLFVPSPDPDTRALREALSAALGELPPEQCEVVHLNPQWPPWRWMHKAEVRSSSPPAACPHGPVTHNHKPPGGWPVDLSRYDGVAEVHVDHVRVYQGKEQLRTQPRGA